MLNAVFIIIAKGVVSYVYKRLYNIIIFLTTDSKRTYGKFSKNEKAQIYHIEHSI